MIKFLLAFGLLLIVLTGIAQKDSVRKYLDANLQFVGKKEAVFPAMAIKDNDHWQLYAVYPDTNILLNVYYKDASLTIKDGPFILYHPKKIIAQKGYFIDNRARGHWQSFYSDGQKKDEGDIINNHFSGVWKEWYQNGIPKSIRTYVYNDSMIAGQPVHENSPATKVSRVVEDLSLEGKIDGAVSTWYENGNKESEVNYHNDSLSGTCKWYRPNGKPSSTEVYTNGKVTDLNCYDDEGNYTGSTCSISKLPVFINPVYSAEDYVENELHKEKHRGVTAYGEVDIRFNITQRGTVENIVIASSPDATLSRLITVIVSKMTAWSPAVTHNRIISYPMKLIIPYYGDK